MRCLGGIMLAACCMALTGCVDLTAVADFAKESSVITANEAQLNDSAALALLYANGNKSALDPNSQQYKDEVTLTQKALTALNSYMGVLAQLSASDLPSVSSETKAIGTDLANLKVSGPEATAALNATTSLTNLLLSALQQRDIKTLVVKAKDPVDTILTYLIAKATLANVNYNGAITLSNEYWSSMVNPTDSDKVFCPKSGLCQPVYVLATRARNADASDLDAKAKAAKNAAAAFTKIKADNDALAQSADHLNAQALIDALKMDEPDLLTVIHSLSGK